MHDAYPLTAPGGEFHVDDALRQMLCYLSDERLLISKSHAFNPHVRGFQARLTHLGRQFRPLMVDLATIEQAYAGTAHGKAAASSSDMQKAAKGMFDRAVDQRASDIHIRVSKREKTKIYFRVHNDLEYKEEHPYDWGAQLCTAIYQAMADVADSTFEPLSRQDARISERAKLPARLDGIRIATTPQVDGFVMVLRLLYNDTTDSVDVGELGHGLQQKNAIEFMKRRPTGINIISGPTGSGKSTTLQRVLGGIIRECQGRLNVITVEDPPEYPIPGAVQTPVTNAATEEERSRAFQEAIKSAMRLDPDVIMIGEIRDTPSARLAIQAAMTGHQVWTTVHANGAFAIIDRLIDLGVPIELVCDPSIVTGLVCQRLVKVLCPECKVHITKVLDRYHQSDVQRIMAVLELDKVYVRGDGCPHCRNSGTIGRTVISETIVTDHKLLSLVRAHDRMSAIEYWKRDQSGITMLEDAITKIQAGRVDPFQAEAVVGPLTMGLIERDMRIEAREVVSAL
ncbi:MAG: ATPase, T2SS/T4P/T4SS family [Pseudomonadota bacterium]